MKVAVMVGRRYVKELASLFNENVEISFFLDNNVQASGENVWNKPVYSPYEFPPNIVDYFIILIYEYQLVNQELTDLGIDTVHIINLGDLGIDLQKYQSIFNIDFADRFRLKLRLDYMEKKINLLEENQRYFEQNYLYEAAAVLKSRKIKLPKIASIEETYKKLISGKCSMSRYGDGEFEIMLGNKAAYQFSNDRLAERLQDILISNLQNHIVAIADDYGMMQGLNEKNKNVIRKYMTEEKREKHYALLDMDKEYYNAYISRPYVIYSHHEIEKAGKRFHAWKRIWDKQKVLLVEGDRTRMGVGNDLFNNAEMVERIIAPNENAFDVYGELCNAVIEYGKGKVILIALGPTATVLAYDLAQIGYWALDIGHLDLEYEWFLKGKGYSYIPHKYNNELLGDARVVCINDQKYKESVVKVILAKN